MDAVRTASTIVSVNPFRCRMWAYHDRLDESLTEDNCRAEIESFEAHGQLVAAVGRRVEDDPDFDVEIVCGARRLFVARHLNKPLRVDLRVLTDREAIVLMDIENRQRMDVSPYERGMSYTRWLRAAHFRSQEDIARALRISPSQVSRLLKIAQLPAVIINAFRSPNNIYEAWGLEIMDALNDPQRREVTIRRAREICARDSRPPAPEVYRLLLSATDKGRKIRPATHDEVVIGDDGKPLFRIRQQRDSIALLLPSRQISARMLESVRDLTARILQGKAATPVSEPDSQHAMLNGHNGATAAGEATSRL